jgi:small subunit ribosomal protein S12
MAGRLARSRRTWRRTRTPHLCGGPHARGLVVRVCIMNPKKPNSAMRHVAKLRLYRRPRVTARIPGRGFGVSKFNRALARGGRANDLPGVGYSLARGACDFAPLFGKVRRRSFYGVTKPRAFIRRKLRRAGCLGYRRAHSPYSPVQFRGPAHQRSRVVVIRLKGPGGRP